MIHLWIPIHLLHSSGTRVGWKERRVIIITCRGFAFGDIFWFPLPGLDTLFFHCQRSWYLDIQKGKNYWYCISELHFLTYAYLAFLFKHTCTVLFAQDTYNVLVLQQRAIFLIGSPWPARCANAQSLEGSLPEIFFFPFHPHTWPWNKMDLQVCGIDGL